MQQIQPSVISPDIVCAETTAPPSGLVVFGASGDLAYRKLFVSIFALFNRDLISEKFYVIGCGRTELSDDLFRKSVCDVIKDKNTKADEAKINMFVKNLYYISGDYNNTAFYNSIKSQLTELDRKHQVDGSHIFYLAVPPFLYENIIEKLRVAGLSCTGDPEENKKVRLVVEKPFGRDLDSAVKLNTTVHKCFDESQVYRIDHYLGKETVQNILMFRFANAIFEPIWNRNFIDHVQITIAESLGIEHRSGYYDKSGALRDMFQNHMLQMLALAAMEPPVSFEADHIRDEKVKLLRAIRSFEPELLSSIFVRGQYGPGKIDGKNVPGYRQEKGVNPESRTETFVAAKLLIDNWRWKDVPFYLRTGKRLKAKDSEITITFKKVPHSMFVSAGLEDMPPNILVLQIQPDEGISLSFQAKRPGSKVCMSTLRMSFSYSEVFGTEPPEAYQRLLLDCMVADQTLFTRYDGVEVAWQLLMPVFESWQADKSLPYEYIAGSESFNQADSLIESDGRKWRKLAVV